MAVGVHTHTLRAASPKPLSTPRRRKGSSEILPRIFERVTPPSSHCCFVVTPVETTTASTVIPAATASALCRIPTHNNNNPIPTGAGLRNTRGFSREQSARLASQREKEEKDLWFYFSAQKNRLPIMIFSKHAIAAFLVGGWAVTQEGCSAFVHQRPVPRRMEAPLHLVRPNPFGPPQDAPRGGSRGPPRGEAGPDSNYIEARLRKLYDEWRRKHDKGDFDPVRYRIFKGNYLSSERAHAAQSNRARMEGRPRPPPFELNEYGDLTRDEYFSLLQQQQQPQQEDATPEEEEPKPSPETPVAQESQTKESSDAEPESPVEDPKDTPAAPFAAAARPQPATTTATTTAATTSTATSYTANIGTKETPAIAITSPPTTQKVSSSSTTTEKATTSSKDTPAKKSKVPPAAPKNAAAPRGTMKDKPAVAITVPPTTQKVSSSSTTTEKATTPVKDTPAARITVPPTTQKVSSSATTQKAPFSATTRKEAPQGSSKTTVKKTATVRENTTPVMDKPAVAITVPPTTQKVSSSSTTTEKVSTPVKDTPAARITVPPTTQKVTSAFAPKHPPIQPDQSFPFSSPSPDARIGTRAPPKQALVAGGGSSVAPTRPDSPSPVPEQSTQPNQTLRSSRPNNTRKQHPLRVDGRGPGPDTDEQRGALFRPAAARGPKSTAPPPYAIPVAPASPPEDAAAPSYYFHDIVEAQRRAIAEQAAGAATERTVVEGKDPAASAPPPKAPAKPAPSTTSPLTVDKPLPTPTSEAANQKNQNDANETKEKTSNQQQQQPFGVPKEKPVSLSSVEKPAVAPTKKALAVDQPLASAKPFAMTPKAATKKSTAPSVESEAPFAAAAKRSSTRPAVPAGKASLETTQPNSSVASFVASRANTKTTEETPAASKPVIEEDPSKPVSKGTDKGKIDQKTISKNLPETPEKDMEAKVPRANGIEPPSEKSGIKGKKLTAKSKGTTPTVAKAEVSAKPVAKYEELISSSVKPRAITTERAPPPLDATVREKARSSATAVLGKSSETKKATDIAAKQKEIEDAMKLDFQKAAKRAAIDKQNKLERQREIEAIFEGTAPTTTKSLEADSDESSFAINGSMQLEDVLKAEKAMAKSESYAENSRSKAVDDILKKEMESVQELQKVSSPTKKLADNLLEAKLEDSRKTATKSKSARRIDLELARAIDPSLVDQPVNRLDDILKEEMAAATKLVETDASDPVTKTNPLKADTLNKNSKSSRKIDLELAVDPSLVDKPVNGLDEILKAEMAAATKLIGTDATDPATKKNPLQVDNFDTTTTRNKVIEKTDACNDATLARKDDVAPTMKNNNSPAGDAEQPTMSNRQRKKLKWKAMQKERRARNKAKKRKAKAKNQKLDDDLQSS